MLLSSGPTCSPAFRTVFVNQLVIYSTDAAPMATVRTASAALEIAFSSMKPERIVLLLASLLLSAGFIVWAVGGAAALQGSGIWLWVGALAILSLPLLLWLLDAIVRAVRR